MSLVPFSVHADWVEVMKSTFIPTIHFNKSFFTIIVAILGTTLSPYLFFWQATMEAEDMSHNNKHIIVNKRILNDMKIDIDLGCCFQILSCFL
jgi:Mn2+/Fe2+ NRAMP family transporter